MTLEMKKSEHSIAPAIVIERGTNFYPFKDVNPVLISDCGSSGEVLFSRSIKLDEMEGSVQLLNASGVKHDVDTPLGYVDSEARQYGNRLTVIKVPLKLAITFRLHSREQYDALRKTVTTIKVGNQIYKIDLTENLSPGVANLVVDKKRLNEVRGVSLYNNNGEKRNVLLPFGINFLARVRLNIDDTSEKAKTLPSQIIPNPVPVNRQQTDLDRWLAEG